MNRSRPIDPDRTFPLVIALLAAIVLWPTFDSGWMGDDAFYANLRGQLGADGRTLFDGIRHAFDLWFWQNGRLYLLGIAEKYAVFYVFTSLAAYKLLLIALTLLALEVFRRTAAAYTDVPFANLCALIAVFLFQQRAYHDATLAYNGSLQLIAIGIFAAAWFLLRTMRGSRPIDPGPALFLFAALLYEAAYPLCAIYAGIARCFTGSWRKAARYAIPYLAAGAGLAIASAAARYVRRLPADSPYRFSGDAAAAVKTAAIQIVAPFPLSYYVFDPSRIFSHTSLRDLYNNAPVNPLLFIVFAVAVWYAMSAARGGPARLREIALTGAALVVLPAISIAPVAKYQAELRFGLGYLPVFIEIFGVALIFGVLAVMVPRTRRLARVAFCLVLAFAGTMTAATNARVARELRPSAVARAALESQLDGGLLASVADGSAVAFDQHFDWVAVGDRGPDDVSTRGLFYAHGHKRLRVVARESPAARVLLVYDRGTNRWSATLK